MQISVLLVLALVLANLPFMTQRLFGVIALKHKSFFMCFIEWGVYFGVLGVFAYFLEKSSGQVHEQEVLFYVVVLCLFAVLAFPGFVWRYFWK